MKKFVSISVLLLLLIWLRWIAVQALPHTSDILASLGSDNIIGWSKFYQGNEHFQASNNASTLSGAIDEIQKSIDTYRESREFLPSQDTDANLQASNERLRMLKDLQKSSTEKSESEKKESDKSDEKTESKSSGSPSTGTSSTGSTSTGSSATGSTSFGSTSTGSTSTGSTFTGSTNSGSTSTGSAFTDSTASWETYKDGQRGYTNSGSFKSVNGFGDSSSSDESASGQVLRELESALQGLKELQTQKGELTRPDGSIPPSDNGNDALLKKFFGEDPVFGGTQNIDPKDY